MSIDKNVFQTKECLFFLVLFLSLMLMLDWNDTTYSMAIPLEALLEVPL